MDTPLITVIIPTYNRAQYIGAAIQSVFAQSYKNLEILVLDDASTDNTSEIVHDLIKNTDQENKENIKYIRHEQNVGITRNRNIGLEKAAGKYVAMLDSDDVWLDPKKLEKQLAFLTESGHEDYALVGSFIEKIDQTATLAGKNAKIRYAFSDAAIRRRILYRNQFTQSSVLMLKQAAVDIGGYDTAYSVNEDYELWLKLGRKYKFANIPEFMTGYRVHAENIMRTKKIDAAKIHLDIIRKYKKDYPGFGGAMLKSYARILRAYF